MYNSLGCEYMQDVLCLTNIATDEKREKITLKTGSFALTWCHNGYYSLHIRDEMLQEDWALLTIVMRRITPDWFLVDDIRRDYEKERVWTEDERWYRYGSITQILIPKLKRTAYYYIRTIDADIL